MVITLFGDRYESKLKNYMRYHPSLILDIFLMLEAEVVSFLK